MPRKTRKQKQKIQTRRLQSNPAQDIVKRDFEFSLKSFPQSERRTNPNKQIEISSQLEEISLVRRDIIKTLILAVCVFSLELVIYFAWLKNSH